MHELEKMLCSTVEQQALGPSNCKTTVSQWMSNKERQRDIVWPSSHDMTTHDDPYQQGSDSSAPLFQT